MGDPVYLRPASPDCVGDRGSKVAADCNRGTAGGSHRRFGGRYAELSLKSRAAVKAFSHDPQIVIPLWIKSDPNQRTR